MYLPQYSEKYNFTFEHYTDDLDIKWFIAKNISGYNFSVHHPSNDKGEFNWDIYGEENDTNIYHLAKETPVYICLDMLFNDAFAHWIYESFIFLPYILKCKELFPNCKVLCKSNKSFKSYFLTHFGIDIVYHVENNNNISFFPEIVSCLNDKECNNKYKRLVDNLFFYFNRIVSIYEKTIPISFLPRQTKENHHQRSYDCSTIVDYVSQNPENIIFHTDMSTCLQDQLNVVGKSKICIITEGSPFLVNSLFMSNTKIVALGDISEKQGKDYLKFIYISDCIKRYNNLITISTSQFNSHNHFDSSFHIDKIKEFLMSN